MPGNVPVSAHLQVAGLRMQVMRKGSGPESSGSRALPKGCSYTLDSDRACTSFIGLLFKRLDPLNIQGWRPIPRRKFTGRWCALSRALSAPMTCVSDRLVLLPIGSQIDPAESGCGRKEEIQYPAEGESPRRTNDRIPV